MEHPWYQYKVSYDWLKTASGSGKTYDLDSVAGRREYYLEKVGGEIEYLRDYFREKKEIVNLQA